MLALVCTIRELENSDLTYPAAPDTCPWSLILRKFFPQRLDFRKMCIVYTIYIVYFKNALGSDSRSTARKIYVRLFTDRMFLLYSLMCQKLIKLSRNNIGLCSSKSNTYGKCCEYRLKNGSEFKICWIVYIMSSDRAILPEIGFSTIGAVHKGRHLFFEIFLNWKIAHTIQICF